MFGRKLLCRQWVLRCAATSVLIATGSVRAEPPRWFRGNTHAHTELCGHADSSPEAVARWYHDHGYNFLCLSEHNRFIDPATVPLPPGKREDFILIPGQEITGSRVIHTTALNTSSLVNSSFVHEHKSEIIQNHVDGAIGAGGTPILRCVKAAERVLIETQETKAYLGSEGDARFVELVKPIVTG